eukprot:COSAG03_NODE_5534_length_1226_cov_1.102041_1_plen_299_part_00
MPAYVAPHRRASGGVATPLTAANLAAHNARHVETEDDMDTDVFGSDDESETSWAPTVDTSATQFREKLSEVLPGLSREDEHAMLRRAKQCGAKVRDGPAHWLCYYDPEHGAFDVAFNPSLCLRFSDDMADIVAIKLIEQGGMSDHEAAVLLWWRVRWLAIDNEMLRNGNKKIEPSCESCLREILPERVSHGKDFRIWPRTPVVTLFARTADVACVRYLLSLGCDPNSKDKAGYTSLHLLSFNYAKKPDLNRARICDTMCALLEAGADTDLLNPHEETCLQLATAAGLRCDQLHPASEA